MKPIDNLIANLKLCRKYGEMTCLACFLLDIDMFGSEADW